ncbi:MAG TPA: serine hydrolase [Verrucomicrobiae bacterium]|nr:serine hydrolase [Verrucomicrobiae bacterium]
MKRIIILSFLTCIVCVSSWADKPSIALPRSTPEAQGISSAAILDFIEAADQQVNAMHSFMLVRHSHVVAEGWWSPYDAHTRHSMYSLSKSFTSTAVGLAVAEGKFSVNDEVLKFFPDEAPAEPSANLRAMRVTDLLRMNTGQHAEDMAKFSFDSSEPLVKLFLSIPVAHKPGTHFWYNTPATFMCSAIVQKTTGQTLLDYLKPRLFDPLGIEGPTWEMKQGISFGGSGLAIRTEDIAKFGQLYLQKGKWHGKQLVPGIWIETATARQTSNGSNPTSDWDQGYGYQFWRCRPGCYRGDGAFGQFCIVMPEQDAVVAITSGTRDMQGVMNLVWDKLLPAMQPKRLRANKESHQKLNQTLATLTLKPQQGNGTPTAAAKWSGKTFTFPTNNQKLEAIALAFGNANTPVTLVTRCNGVEQRTACGNGTWIKSRMTYADLAEQPVAASGAWTANDTYTAQLSFYETPFCLTVSLKFADNQLLYDCEYNVSFGPTKQPQLAGKPQ